MDADTVKTSAGDKGMDMMAMMMQMEKLPEFCDSFYNTTTYSDIEFSGGNYSTGIACATQPILPSQCIVPPAALMENPRSTTTFMSNPIQEPVTPPLQSNALSGRLKSSNTAYPFPSTSDKKNSMVAMREMIFRMAVMQPILIDPESIKPPKRRNVKISKDPQSVAARHRRERISERIRILQRLVPGGTKMDTASMLDEAIHYVKFLKKQVQTLEQTGAHHRPMGVLLPGITNTNLNHSALFRGGQPSRGVDPMHMLR